MVVRWVALATFAALWSVLVGAIVGGQLVQWDVVVLAATASVVLLLVDRWHKTDRFPQWVYDPPHIDVEVAQPPDQFGERWLQGLHLTAKNRPRRQRKTRPARDAMIHVIMDGGSMGGPPFQTDLVWSVFGPPTKITNLVSGDRVYIPLAMKAIGAPAPGERLVSGHAALAAARVGTTYLMDDRYHRGDPHELQRGAEYNIAAWVEYDGGKTTARAYFRLHIDKDVHAKNQLSTASG